MITSTDFSITGLHYSKKITFLLDKNHQAQVETIKKCYNSIIGTTEKTEGHAIYELCIKIKLYSEGFEVLATVGANEEIQKKIGSSKFPYGLLKIVVIIIHFESELRHQLNIRLYYKIASLCLTSLIATSSDNFMEEIMERAQEIFIIFNKINHFESSTNKISKSGFEFILHFFQILSTLSKSYANKKKLFLSFSNKLLEHAMQTLATITAITSDNNGSTNSSNKLSALRDVLEDLIQTSLFQDDKHILELSQVSLTTIQQNKIKEEAEMLLSFAAPSNQTPSTTTAPTSNSQRKRKLKDDSVSIQSFYSSFYSAITHMKLRQQHLVTHQSYPPAAAATAVVASGIGHVFQLYIQKSTSSMLQDCRSAAAAAAASNSDTATASTVRLKHYFRLLRGAFCLIQCCSSPLFGDFITATATANSNTAGSTSDNDNNNKGSVSNETENNDKSHLKKKKRKLNKDITGTTAASESPAELPAAATTSATTTTTAPPPTHIISLQCVNAILRQLDMALSEAGSLPTHNDVIRSLLQQLSHLGEQAVTYLYHSAQDQKESSDHCKQIANQCFEMLTLLLNIDHRSIISWESSSGSNSRSNHSISSNAKEPKNPSLQRLLLAIVNGSASAVASIGSDGAALKTGTLTQTDSRSSGYSLLLANNISNDNEAAETSRSSEKLLHKLCAVYCSLSKMNVIVKECLMTSTHPAFPGEAEAVTEEVEVDRQVSCDRILGSLLQLPGLQSQLLRALGGLPTPQILLCWESVEETMSGISSGSTTSLGASCCTLSAILTPLVNASLKQCWSMPLATINTLLDRAVTSYQINRRNISVVQVITLLLQFGSLAVSYATESQADESHMNPDDSEPSDPTTDAVVTIDSHTNMDDSDSYNEDEEEEEVEEDEEEEEYNEDEEEVEEDEEEVDEEYNEDEESLVAVMKESNIDDEEEEGGGGGGNGSVNEERDGKNLSTVSTAASPSASMAANPTTTTTAVAAVSDDVTHWNRFNGTVTSLLLVLAAPCHPEAAVPDDRRHARNGNNSSDGSRTSQTETETSQCILLLESCNYIANYNANEYFTRCATGTTTIEKIEDTPLTVSKILMIFWKFLQSKVTTMKTNKNSSNIDNIQLLFGILLRYESVWKSEKTYRILQNNNINNDELTTVVESDGRSAGTSKRGGLRELQYQVCGELLVLWIHQQLLLLPPLVSRSSINPEDHPGDYPTATTTTTEIQSNFLFQMIASHSSEFEFLTGILFSELFKITKELHQTMLSITTTTTTNPTSRVTATSSGSLAVVLGRVEGALLGGLHCIQSWNSSIRYSDETTRNSVYRYILEVSALTSSLLTLSPRLNDSGSSGSGSGNTSKSSTSSSLNSHSTTPTSNSNDMLSLACTLCQSLLVRYTSIYSSVTASTSTSSFGQSDVLTALETLFHGLLVHLFTSTDIGSTKMGNRMAIFDMFYFTTDIIITQSLLLLSAASTSSHTTANIEVHQAEVILVNLLQAIVPYLSPLHLLPHTPPSKGGSVAPSGNHKDTSSSDHAVKLVTVVCNSICKHLQGLKISPRLVNKISSLFNHVITDHQSFWDAHFLTSKSDGNGNDRDNSRKPPDCHHGKNHKGYNMSIGSSYFITADITRTLSFLNRIEKSHLTIPPLLQGTVTTTTTTATATAMNSNGWLYLTGIICMLLRHQKLTLSAPASMALINTAAYLLLQDEGRLREEIIEMFVYQFLYSLPTYCYEVFISRIMTRLIAKVNLSQSDRNDDSSRSTELLLAICEGILQSERRKDVLFVQVINSALESIANGVTYEEQGCEGGDVSEGYTVGDIKEGRRNASSRATFRKILSLMRKAMTSVFVGQEKKTRKNKSSNSNEKENENGEVIKASVENGNNSSSSSKGSVDLLSLWASSNLCILSELARKLNTTVTARNTIGTVATCTWTLEACSLMLGVLEQLLGLPVALLGPSVGVIGTLLQLLLSVLVRTCQYPEDAGGDAHSPAGRGGVAAALRQGARTMAAVASSKELTKHCPQVAAAIIDGFSSSSGGSAFSAEVKELLMPGLFALFDRCQQRQRKQMFALLDVQGAALLQDLYEIYMRDYKFVGKS